jgi:type IV pilus assembly protein PilV
MPMNTFNRLQVHQEGGFTLLEILVAMVVISLGLLGLAGLQALSLRNNQVAHYRSIASQQAYDMGDRIRANLAGVRLGQYDTLAAGVPTDPNCFTTGCGTPASGTNTQMAQTDRFQWNTLNGRVLPAGSGSVRCIEGPAATCAINNANTNRIYEITVSWTERTADGNITQSFVTRFVP